MMARALVISLQRATTRLAHAQSLLAQLPLVAEILPAVDGAAMSKQEIDAVYARHLHQPRYPFELRVGEIGCFLSHRKAWQTIVDQDLDAALVMEDDVLIDGEPFERAIDFIKAHAPRDSYVQLPVRQVPRDVISIAASGAQRMLLSTITPLRTSGQWVTRIAAKRLLAATERFDRPVDTTLQMHWITGVRCLTLDPSGITDLTTELGGSTIGVGKKKRLTFEKVSREFSRAYYRAQIARLSAKAAG
ncbi:Glycosyltransferase family 25 (LPS biosynthesis protein) [Planctomycetes bacterium CA13]|uniref:Glycosyltransferase family 25 (LPS biosynthesis protein) n=1 Tax=Novipirellula herctigrandis TaxID=2527986 RepID=A0A5C5YW54_9BACT|nr:Glycosyltransferase family 25 (LPS biosynthesis protein) [Planctomycetes bacterium CA13]